MATGEVTIDVTDTEEKEEKEEVVTVIERTDAVSTWLTFFIVLLLVWLSVSFWQRGLTNLFFGTFNLDPDSTLVTLCIAVGVTILTAGVIWIIARPIIGGGFGGGFGDISG
ncbi:Hypothetical protein POVN_LOCUS285 [uncultured virus]|nr:Hypothetical protein POVN_LOCUS285 [uncultured virus]